MPFAIFLVELFFASFLFQSFRALFAMYVYTYYIDSTYYLTYLYIGIFSLYLCNNFLDSVTVSEEALLPSRGNAVKVGTSPNI